MIPNLPLSSPYAREVWDYNKADGKNTQGSIKTSNWAGLFINLTISERVGLLSNTLTNIFKNYIPNKKINLNTVKHRG